MNDGASPPQEGSGDGGHQRSFYTSVIAVRDSIGATSEAAKQVITVWTVEMAKLQVPQAA